jgi:hypothetical protein
MSKGNTYSKKEEINPTVRIYSGDFTGIIALFAGNFPPGHKVGIMDG